MHPESPVNPFLLRSHTCSRGSFDPFFLFLTICSVGIENKETDKANRANDAVFTAGYTIQLLFFFCTFYMPPAHGVCGEGRRCSRAQYASLRSSHGVVTWHSMEASAARTTHEVVKSALPTEL